MCPPEADSGRWLLPCVRPGVEWGLMRVKTLWVHRWEHSSMQAEVGGTRLPPGQGVLRDAGLPPVNRLRVMNRNGELSEEALHDGQGFGNVRGAEELTVNHKNVELVEGESFFPTVV